MQGCDGVDLGRVEQQDADCEEIYPSVLRRNAEAGSWRGRSRRGDKSATTLPLAYTG